jgi:hypothetical protein
VQVNAQFDQPAAGNFSLKMTASATINTVFSRLLGQSTMSMSASSQVLWGIKKLNLALVLDNTGSMSSSGKMTNLKTAAHNLDDCPFTNSSHGFYCAPNPTSSSTTSSVPSSRTYKGYICPSNDTGKKNSALAGLAYNGCYTSVSTTQQVSSGWSASCGSYSNCSCSGSGSSKKCTRTYYKHDWVVNNHDTWNGCVVDRGNSSAPSSGNYDQNVTCRPRPTPPRCMPPSNMALARPRP